MQLQELKQHLDIDVDGALARFSGVESLYLKYLKRFAEGDKSYNEFVLACESHDIKEIEESAHALKGICGNLGLNDLYTRYDRIVSAARRDELVEALALAEGAKDATYQCMTLLQQLSS